MLIKILLLLAAAGALVFFVRGWGTARTRAWKRLGFFAFLMLTVDFVLRPEDSNRVAHQLGVGRGADLVLYGLVVAFAFITLNTYMRFREMERKLTDLARSVAINTAVAGTEEALERGLEQDLGDAPAEKAPKPEAVAASPSRD
ncbi:DUF2304 domain-containing protein [Streptomyces sp. H10-C2]|uniref:DUF2304 domain-containing protein n=1 Tax=unclassified Streptomyces TaxID=2593676 RepID=UPI0024B92607|nr:MULTISPECIES: DUF2304 domain-containing protein [unclassified Streptomyces]MDJ0342460.1 DUF2304 domain-containing protein [Streptomyces sp. PH10-H1]MDJ0372315.1 DUF2304 domain-containing protein [Streptomyces sp. H10-C2]